MEKSGRSLWLSSSAFIAGPYGATSIQRAPGSPQCAKIAAFRVTRLRWPLGNPPTSDGSWCLHVRDTPHLAQARRRRGDHTGRRRTGEGRREYRRLIRCRCAPSLNLPARIHRRERRRPWGLDPYRNGDASVISSAAVAPVARAPGRRNGNRCQSGKGSR
jgi:hypothetical protein